MTKTTFGRWLIFLVGTLCCSTALAFDSLSSAQVKEAKDALVKFFDSLNSFHPTVATVVRLAFHDCVGSSCDGCLNLDMDDNNGLSTIIDLLDTVYKGKFDSVMSRADFWQLAGITGVEYTVEKNNKVCQTDSRVPCTPRTRIPFRWGRKDCATSPKTSETAEFPAADMSSAEMFGWFQNNMGFNKREVTALMAVHTLGKAQVKHSGYSGAFSPEQENLFNNHYYTDMIRNVKFTNFANEPDSTEDKEFQFNLERQTRSGSHSIGMRLSTDVELAYDIDVNPLTGTSCDVVPPSFRRRPRGNVCGLAETFPVVKLFSDDPRAWVHEFSEVYTKMTEHGNAGNLKLVA